MSRLIREGHPVTDEYTELADDQAAPAAGAVIVSLARWQAERGALEAGGRRIGVRIPNVANISTVGPDVLQAATIVLEFPSFADGRAYSQARALRDRFGFRGELRATGKAVVRDQLHGMLRCGFDAFEVRDDQSVDTFISAIRDFSLAYQPAADILPRVSVLRRN